MLLLLVLCQYDRDSVKTELSTLPTNFNLTIESYKDIMSLFLTLKCRCDGKCYFGTLLE